MSSALARTIWRGVQIDHPGDWELTLASGAGEPGRCVFSDRLYERLNVRWRDLKYVPNLDLMLDKFRRRTKENVRLCDLQGAPPGWRGIVRKADDGTIVHAGKFFRPERMLVETILIWPKLSPPGRGPSTKRDVALENAVLSSIRLPGHDLRDKGRSGENSTDGGLLGGKSHDNKNPQPVGSSRQWRAMGIHLTMPSECELVVCRATVGRIRWEFVDTRRPARRQEPNLTVERLALPNYWLLTNRTTTSGALDEWMLEQLPPQFEVFRQDQTNLPHRQKDIGGTFTRHPVQRLISHRKQGRFIRLCGLNLIRRKVVRLDQAWWCPVENRVYHLSLTETTAMDEIFLPENLEVHCCQPAPVINTTS